MCCIKSIICQRLEKSVTCAAFLEQKKPLIMASVYVTTLRGKKEAPGGPSLFQNWVCV